MFSRNCVGKNPGANSLLGNFVDEPTSTASTGGDVGAVESMEEGVVSASESETTKRDDCVFSKTESQTNVQKKQLHSGDDMQNLRRGHNRETGFAFGVFGRRRRPEDPAAFDCDTIGAESCSHSSRELKTEPATHKSDLKAVLTRHES
ncbi:hypothetical protein F2Q69_00011938 [Brassica cretica]|uniref:Uncharacterized protein n=1 Tax=Brassica cretica TaxID=69181 RepID=A0A8S9QVE6_BRACR|nr:hypothetical protein F2Q69_00011938 [Brassica cretica]